MRLEGGAERGEPLRRNPPRAAPRGKQGQVRPHSHNPPDPSPHAHKRWLCFVNCCFSLTVWLFCWSLLRRSCKLTTCSSAFTRTGMTEVSTPGPQRFGTLGGRPVLVTCPVPHRLGCGVTSWSKDSASVPRQESLRFSTFCMRLATGRELNVD